MASKQNENTGDKKRRSPKLKAFKKAFAWLLPLLFFFGLFHFKLFERRQKAWTNYFYRIKHPTQAKAIQTFRDNCRLSLRTVPLGWSDHFHSPALFEKHLKQRFSAFRLSDLYLSLSENQAAMFLLLKAPDVLVERLWPHTMAGKYVELRFLKKDQDGVKIKNRYRFGDLSREIERSCKIRINGFNISKEKAAFWHLPDGHGILLLGVYSIVEYNGAYESDKKINLGFFRVKGDGLKQFAALPLLWSHTNQKAHTYAYVKTDVSAYPPNTITVFCEHYSGANKMRIEPDGQASFKLRFSPTQSKFIFSSKKAKTRYQALLEKMPRAYRNSFSLFKKPSGSKQNSYVLKDTDPRGPKLYR